MTKLSKTMVAALDTIRARYTAAVAAELARWGAESAATVETSGVAVADLPSRTILALEARGLILVRRVRGTSSHLRRGSYGRWLGGSTTRNHVALYAAPTQNEAK